MIYVFKQVYNNIYYLSIFVAASPRLGLAVSSVSKWTFTRIKLSIITDKTAQTQTGLNVTSINKRKEKGENKSPSHLPVQRGI